MSAAAITAPSASGSGSAFDRVDRLRRLAALCASDREAATSTSVLPTEFLVTVQYLSHADAEAAAKHADTIHACFAHHGLADRGLAMHEFALLLQDCTHFAQQQREREHSQPSGGGSDSDREFLQYLCARLDAALAAQCLHASDSAAQQSAALQDSLASTRLALRQSEVAATSATDRLAQSMQHLRLAETELADLRAQLAASDERVRHDRDTFDTLTRTVSQHQETVAHLTAERRAVESDLLTVRESQQSQLALLQFERQARSNLASELAAAKETINALQQARSAEMREELRKKKQEMNLIMDSRRFVKELQQQAARVPTIEREAQTLRDRLVRAEEDLQEYARICQSLQKSALDCQPSEPRGNSLFDELASNGPSAAASRRSSVVQPVPSTHSRRPSANVVPVLTLSHSNMLTDALNEARDKLAEAEKSLAEARNNRDELIALRGKLEAQCDSAQDEARQARDREQAARDELASAQLAWTSERGEWQAKLAALLDPHDVQRSFDQLRMQAAEHEATIQQLLHKIAKLEAELEQWNKHQCPIPAPVPAPPSVPVLPASPPTLVRAKSSVSWKLVSLSPAEQAEVRAYATFINASLGADADLAHLLPVNPSNSELLAKVSDGLLIAKLINAVSPGTIDERVLNKRGATQSCLSWQQLVENLNLCVSAAKAIGVTMRQKEAATSPPAAEQRINAATAVVALGEDTELEQRTITRLVSASVAELDVPTVERPRSSVVTLHHSRGGSSVASSVGRGVDLGDAQLQLMDCTQPALLIDFFFQLIAVQLVNPAQPKLFARRIEPDDDTARARLMSLAPDALLLAWINAAAKRRGQPPLKEFGADFALAMHAVCDELSGVTKRVEEERSAGGLLERLVSLGVAHFHEAEDVELGRVRLNLLLAAVTFHHWVAATTQSQSQPLSQSAVDTVVAGVVSVDPSLLSLEQSLSEDAREEVAFRAWLNAAGIPNLWCHDLSVDCQDGLLLLKLIDWVQPNTVDWKAVELKPTNKFKSVTNCNYALKLCKDKLRLSLVGIGGEDIYDALQKYILAVIWQLMRFHALKKIEMLRAARGQKQLQPINDADILDWANKRAATCDAPVAVRCRALAIKSWRDPALTTSLFVLSLLHAISGQCVDWQLVRAPEPSAGLTVDASPTLELSVADRLSNASYAIGVARKLGVEAWLRPHDIVECKPKMILMLIGSCMTVDAASSSSDDISKR